MWPVIHETVLFSFFLSVVRLVLLNFPEIVRANLFNDLILPKIYNILFILLSFYVGNFNTIAKLTF